MFSNFLQAETDEYHAGEPYSTIEDTIDSLKVF